MIELSFSFGLFSYIAIGLLLLSASLIYVVVRIKPYVTLTIIAVLSAMVAMTLLILDGISLLIIGLLFLVLSAFLIIIIIPIKRNKGSKK